MSDTIKINCPHCGGTGNILKRGWNNDPEGETLGPCDHMDCEDGLVELDAEEVERIVMAARAMVALRPATRDEGVTELRRALIAGGVA